MSWDEMDGFTVKASLASSLLFDRLVRESDQSLGQNSGSETKRMFAENFSGVSTWVLTEPVNACSESSQQLSVIQAGT